MGKYSLNELMGKGGKTQRGEKLTLDDLHELLGERAPKIEFSPVGRLRLITAMRNRFGDSWKNLPGLSDIVSEFDRETDFNIKLQQMKLIKAKK